jgi:hypothetical protein
MIIDVKLARQHCCKHQVMAGQAELPHLAMFSMLKAVKTAGDIAMSV